MYLGFFTSTAWKFICTVCSTCQVKDKLHAFPASNKCRIEADVLSFVTYVTEINHHSVNFIIGTVHVSHFENQSLFTQIKMIKV